MKKLILALLIGLNFTVTPTATVDRIENDYAVIEVGNKMVSVPTEDFNNPIAEGAEIPVSMAVGSFEWYDGNDWYQFKSYTNCTEHPEEFNHDCEVCDEAVWWALTPKDIGFVPEANKTYVLVYYDNGTTDCTECAEEFDCECEVYDDIFLAIYEGGI
jgi:hypothetical protein